MFSSPARDGVVPNRRAPGYLPGPAGIERHSVRPRQKSPWSAMPARRRRRLAESACRP